MEKQVNKTIQEEDEFERGVDMGYMHAILLHRLAQGGDREAIVTKFYADFNEEFQFTDEERVYIESDEAYGIEIS